MGQSRKISKTLVSGCKPHIHEFQEHLEEEKKSVAQRLFLLLFSRVQLFCKKSPYGLQPARLLPPWNSPGKNTGGGLPFLSPGDLPNTRIKPCRDQSPALAGVFFTIKPSQKPQRPSLVYLKCWPANILRNLNLCLLHSIWDIWVRVLIASLMRYMNLEDLVTVFHQASFSHL